MPISGMILLGVMQMPCSSRALRTSAVERTDSFLVLLTSLIDFMSSIMLLRVISAMAPSRLKKLSSLHSSPTFSQTRLTRHSGMMLLVREDSTRMECTSLSRCTCSFPSYSNSGASSPTFCISSSSSQFSSIKGTQLLCKAQLIKSTTPTAINKGSPAAPLDLQTNMQKYDIMGIIGEGAYGVVLKCRSNENSEVVAIKKFKETEEDEIVKKTTMREVKVLKMLKHPNIVELKEAFRKKGIVYLVFEYVQNNLLEVLEKSQDGLDPELIRLYMYQLLKGLAYMHSLHLMHRDVKPQNLLISDRKELKICDFGFARQIKKSAGEEEMTDYVATRWYRPPELLVGAPYSREIDIWAVGCIMGELIDGNPMFPGENELDQLFLIQKTLGRLTPDHQQTFLKNPRFLGMKFPQIHNLQTIDKKYLGKLSPKALNFLKQLLKMNPSDRLSAIDALKHPYFDGLREDDFLRKLSSNSYLKHEGKMSSIIPSREEDPKSVNQDRKKYSNAHNPYTYERERTEETGTSEFNRSTKINMNKKTKEEVNRLVNTKGFQGHINSKSVNKSKPMQKQTKEKNMSLEKHQNREILTKTQTGFYILTGGGVIEQKEEEYTSMNSNSHSRNKIYNTRSPKSKQIPKRNIMTHAEEIAQEDEFWQSSSQLPHIMVGSHNAKMQKSSKLQVPANIIITNSTFNYKTHH